MAPSRGKGKARPQDRTPRASTAYRHTTRGTAQSKDAVPDVYGEMLAEAASVDAPDGFSDRPLKRRRMVARSVRDASNSDVTTEQPVSAPSHSERQVQIVEDSSPSDDDSDESEYEFEDVELEQTSEPDQYQDVDGQGGIADVTVSVDAAPKRQVRSKRKPATMAEKAHRILVHKFHILCLLGHCIYANSWCNDEEAHQLLRPLLSKKLVTFLNPRSENSQFRQNEAFMDGLNQAAEVFRGEFKVTASGMGSAHFTTGSENSVTQPIDRVEFISAAKQLEGSQDIGNQLFCALLRAVGVEARLVCSLQAVPFVKTTAKPSTPQKHEKPTLRARLYDIPSPSGRSSASDVAIPSSSTIDNVPSARRRIGQPAFEPSSFPATRSPSRSKNTVPKLTHPIFWVEAFNSAHQKWIPVDPIVTRTTNKPLRLEPPSSDTSNHLSYAVAFEASAVARDVTRRYARAFNAKTRRSRVESTEGGAAWLNQVLKMFRRKGPRWDREQVEDAEFAQREAREGLPANVLDFKDHPYYALERHLKRHEVIFPKREVGKVNAGTAAKPRMEAVFRRQDVCVCRSADKWYRLGRTVKTGEVAVKRVVARRTQRVRSPSQEGSENEDRSMTPLYAGFQTEAYIPPAVVDGRVPRNVFGNLDVYVPSMVPAGGQHVRHPLARDAALALKVDAVDAVVGFQFKGRQGTAVTDGVVVPAKYADAVKAIIEGLEDERLEERSRERSFVALKIWKRFLTALRIRERVSAYADKAADINEDTYAVSEDDGEEAKYEHFATMSADDEPLLTAGKFSLSELMTPTKKSTKNTTRKKYEDSDGEPSFDDNDSNGDISVDASKTALRRGRRNVINDHSDEEGLLQKTSTATRSPEGVPDSGGGFLPEDGASEGDRNAAFNNTAASMDPEGGFLPSDMIDEGDNVGGGFIPDPQGDRDGFLPDAPAPHDEGDDGAGFTTDDGGGGGFIADDEGTPSPPSIEQDHSNPPMPSHDQVIGSDGARQEGGTAHFQHDGHIDDEPAVDANMHTSQLAIESDRDSIAVDTRRAESDGGKQSMSHQTLSVAPISELDAANASDHGSMLSHDPEDEDAEPDWLESD